MNHAVFFTESMSGLALNSYFTGRIHSMAAKKKSRKRTIRQKPGTKISSKKAAVSAKSGKSAATSTRFQTSQNYGYYALLLITIALIVTARVHFLPMPFDRDEGAYGYLGWMALSGGTPYIDFYEMKPPLLFYSYALIIAIFGKGTVGLHLAALLLNLSTTYFVFRIGRHVWGAQGGIISAIAFLFLAFNTYASGFAMQSEVIVLAFAAPGLFLTLDGAQQRTIKRVFWGGVLLSCAALVKQNGVLFCLGGILTMLLYIWPLKSWDRRALLKWLAAFIVGGVAPVLLCLLLLLVTGSLDDFWYWIVEHPTKYVTSRTLNEGLPNLFFFGKGVIAKHTFWVAATIAGVALMAFVTTLKLKQKLILSALFVVSGLSILPGMRFYGHYWLMFFMGWSLVIPGFFVLLAQLLKKQPRLSWLPLLVLTAGIVWHMTGVWDTYYRSNLNDINRTVYQGNFFAEHKMLADWLEPQLRPEDGLIVMGSEPQMYLYTNKKSPTRHAYMTFTSKVIPEAKRWENEVMRDIERSKPEYVVFNYEPFSWMFKPDSRREMYNWMFRKTQSEYTHIAVFDLDRGGASQLITGPAAQTYTPRQSSYIVVSRRNDMQ